MRTLCLNLQNTKSLSWTESLSMFNPYVQSRKPGFVFADISRSSENFDSEENLLHEIIELSRDFFPGAHAAISDTPFAAQALSFEKEVFISQPHQEAKALDPLPVDSILNLEGLNPWKNSEQIEDIALFFKVVGLENLGQVRQLGVESFRERWGQTGMTLWKRLNGLERQIIPPNGPEHSFQDFVSFQIPVSVFSLLFHAIRKSLNQLMNPLSLQQRQVEKVTLQLTCEYDRHFHLVECFPSAYDQKMYRLENIIEDEISKIDLENPICSFDLEVITQPANGIKKTSSPKISHKQTTSGLLDPYDSTNEWLLFE